MELNKLKTVAATEDNPKWNEFIRREKDIYKRNDDIRSEFARDYTRVLHSLAYRRLKHKTQVFFNAGNDHICTRIEHVSHVESVSSTISNYLGLNTELTKAIAIGHDLGHAPFGHQGETVLKKLTEEYFHKDFWHEKNGVYFVDRVELLEDNYKICRNLNLTYAVRDGIISHCGEVDDDAIKPREEMFSLDMFVKAGQFQAASWEGCIVKIADKIAYLGRDIEDAIRLGLLDKEKQELIQEMARINDQKAINTTVIIHNMIIDLCENSSVEKGLCLSSPLRKQINEIKAFNYEYIYHHEKLNTFKKYSELVINEIFNALLSIYDGKNTLNILNKRREEKSILISDFGDWIVRYCDFDYKDFEWADSISKMCDNEKIYGLLETKEKYVQAIIDYIAGMTDNYAIRIFDELLAY